MTSFFKLGFQLALLLLVSACDGLRSASSEDKMRRDPVLQDITEEQILQINLNLSPAIGFGNRGGNPTSCSFATGQTPPAGLTVGVSADRSSCAITGAPTMLANKVTYRVVAENSSGTSTAMVSITVLAEVPITRPPMLSANIGDTIFFTSGGANTPITFTNTGGRASSCALGNNQVLPMGLSVGSAPNQVDCVIQGTPTQVMARTTYTVIASNNLGNSMGTVRLRVADPATLAFCDPLLPERLQTSASYQVTVNTMWSQANNGLALPNNAHFTNFIGATHSADYQIWAAGVMATAGVENTAETGGTTIMRGEIAAQQTNGHVGSILTFQAPPSTGSRSTRLTITCTHPLVSLLSMLAPSPDWFIGVHDADLLDDNDNWRQLLTIKLYPYDAGTEDTRSMGSPFSLSGTESSPHIPIARLAGSNVIGFVPPQDLIGTVVFTRLDIQTSAGPPVLQNIAEEKILQVNLNISPEIRFGNTGGNPTSCRLTTGQVAPAGLTVGVSADQSSCAITGTPITPVSKLTYRVVAEHSSGPSMATISITVNNESPALQNIAEEQILQVNLNISPEIRFGNTGGNPTRCSFASGQATPAGLTVGVSADQSSCAITGTPIMPVSKLTYSVVAENSGGPSMATISITVNDEPPALPASIADTILFIGDGAMINPITFVNTGGRANLCILDSNQVLPTGLSVGSAPNQAGCVIQGTPTQAMAQTTYTVIARNDAADSMGMVRLRVVDPATLAFCDPLLPERLQTGASYQVTVNTIWSQASNGVPLPAGNPHFTAFIGATHSANYQIWAAGVLATSGVESTAETGGTGTMRNEIVAQQTNGHAGNILAFRAPSPTGSRSVNFMITCAHPLVSFLSMLAPSPDWFIGVHDVDLLDDSDNWRASMTINMYPYDAGTEDTRASGSPFSLGGTESNPHTPIARLAGSSVIGFIPPRDLIGTVVFTRMDEQ